MSAKSDPRPASVTSEYYVRRPLRLPEMMAAIGASIAVGAAAFYVARIVMGRSPIAATDERPTRGIARLRRPILRRARSG